jgi:hypothetical protein
LDTSECIHRSLSQERNGPWSLRESKRSFIQRRVSTPVSQCFLASHANFFPTKLLTSRHTLRPHSCLSLRQAALEKQSSTRSTPGPIYNANVNACSTSKNKCRDITFGSGPARFDVPEINSRRPSTPGPQSYNPNLLAASGRSSRSTRFGSATRACNADSPSGKQTPSPSEYDPESIRQGLAATRRGSSASITFGKATSSDKRSRSEPCVGPQSYDPDMIRRGIMSTRRSSVQSVTFGRPSSARPSSARPSSARPSTRRGSDHQQPSPQQYDTEAIRRGVFSLSTKRRPSGVAFTDK